MRTPHIFDKGSYWCLCLPTTRWQRSVQRQMWHVILWRKTDTIKEPARDVYVKTLAEAKSMSLQDYESSQIIAAFENRHNEAESRRRRRALDDMLIAERLKQRDD